MGKGGDLRKGEEQSSQGALSQSLPCYTWEEIETHCTRASRWIVIDNCVYDVTNWLRRHPGGHKVIEHVCGQDCSDAFYAFHPDVGSVRKIMKNFHIGYAETVDSVDNNIRMDFAQMRKKFEREGLFKPSVLFYILFVAQAVLFEVAGFLVLYYFGCQSWTAYLIAIALAGTAQVQAGWLQHDFGHLSVFKTLFMNTVAHHLLVGFFKGASSTWWKHMHNRHHGKPNVIGKDPDVRLDLLLVVGQVMPVEVARTRKSSLPYNYQHRYFFATLPPLLFPVYFQIMIFYYCIYQKAWKDLLIVFIFFLRFGLMFYWVLGGSVTSVLIFYFLVRCFESHQFVWVTQSNHIPMPIEHDANRTWFCQQIRSSCNITKSFFNDWFTGHLNHQIEHHLFPLMPRHNLYRTTDEIRAMCDKYDIKYIVKPLTTAFADIIRSLEHSGQLWYSTYSQYWYD